MKKLFLLGMLFATFVISGCAGKVYKPEAFKTKGKFAIVQVSGQTSGFGLGTAEDKKLLNSLAKIAYKELKNTKYFKTINPKRVKKSRAYKKMKTDTDEGLLTMKVADGYKKFDPRDHKDELKKLFRELKITGAISITAGYSKASSGLSLSGLLPIPIPVSVGTEHGKLGMMIYAIDKDANVIWQDMIEVETEEGVGSFMGLSNFKKLYPQLVHISKKAVIQAIANLENNIK